MGQIRASSSNCIPQCDRKRNACIVAHCVYFDKVLHSMAFLFSRNLPKKIKVERNVNEFVKSNEKKLKPQTEKADRK